MKLIAGCVGCSGLFNVTLLTCECILRNSFTSWRHAERKSEVNFSMKSERKKVSSVLQSLTKLDKGKIDYGP